MTNTLPQEFQLRIQENFGAFIRSEIAFARRPFKAFRVNALKVQIPIIKQWLAEQGIIFKGVDWYSEAFIVPVEFAPVVLDSAWAKEGGIYAQGLESMLSVLVLAPNKGERVLDLCAAPGSKTSLIAALMQNEGSLIANEPVKNRFYRLKSVLELTGTKAQLSMKDGRFLRSNELFDKVLVDAPCSSEGRFIDGEEKSFAYWSVRKIHEMAHKQKGLLLNASRLVKPGGRLVYSTCTFAPEENEAVIDWFLRKSEHAFELEDITIPGIARYPVLSQYAGKAFGHDLTRALRVLPTEVMEGFFIVSFKRIPLY